MKHEIFRNENIGTLVWVRFFEHVPLENREALMNNGFSYDWNFKAWGSLNRPDEEIERIINNVVVSERPKMSKVEEMELEQEYIRRELATGFSGDCWVKYFKGKIGALVRLENGQIVNIEKPSIETSFCYGESGYDADEAFDAAERARTSEDHFRWANLRGLKEDIDILERLPGEGYFVRTCVTLGYDKEAGKDTGLNTVAFSAHWDRWHNKPTEEVSEEDRERILEGYRKVYAAFEKRINTYLKKYGLSKVRAWTYWRDA